jgi:hypothetical protein
MHAKKRKGAFHEPACSAVFPACGFTGLSSPVDHERATGKSPKPAGSKACAASTGQFMVPMHAKNERKLSMNVVAQPYRLRVAAASRRQHEHWAGRPVNSQARTTALHPTGSSSSQCTRKNTRRLYMNRIVLPASCRQRNWRSALPPAHQGEFKMGRGRPRPRVLSVARRFTGTSRPDEPSPPLLAHYLERTLDATSAQRHADCPSPEKPPYSKMIL